MSLYLRLWFLRPLKDIDVLTKRQSAIEYLHNPSHSDVTSSLSEYLKNIKNVPRILVRMAESRLSMTEWQALYKVMQCDIT
jgi:DNA mismatch repair protein MSH5